MTFKELNKHDVVEQAHLVFLNDLPLCEIDNKNVRAICERYRSNNICFSKCQKLFKQYFEYFYNWAYSNWMTNVFYNIKN